MFTATERATLPITIYSMTKSNDFNKRIEPGRAIGSGETLSPASRIGSVSGPQLDQDVPTLDDFFKSSYK